jgi:hypothetical protein
VVEGRTGVFFREPAEGALASALMEVTARTWDRAAISAHASRFDVRTFKTRMREFVTTSAAEHAPVRLDGAYTVRRETLFRERASVP